MAILTLIFSEQLDNSVILFYGGKGGELSYLAERQCYQVSNADKQIDFSNPSCPCLPKCVSPGPNQLLPDSLFNLKKKEKKKTRVSTTLTVPVCPCHREENKRGVGGTGGRGGFRLCARTIFFPNGLNRGSAALLT